MSTNLHLTTNIKHHINDLVN